MGRHGANLDTAFAVADKAGCRLTQQIFDSHKGDAEITFKAAQRRYNAHRDCTTIGWPCASHVYVHGASRSTLPPHASGGFGNARMAG